MSTKCDKNMTLKTSLLGMVCCALSLCAGVGVLSLLMLYFVSCAMCVLCLIRERPGLTCCLIGMRRYWCDAGLCFLKCSEISVLCLDSFKLEFLATTLVNAVIVAAYFAVAAAAAASESLSASVVGSKMVS